MEHPIVALFNPVLDCKSRDEAISYLLQHPVLTSPYYEELLEGWAAKLVGSRQQAALRSLALRKEVWDGLRSGKIKLTEQPRGILDLSLSVMQGRITEQYACQVASQRESFVELMFPMIHSACVQAERLVQKNWRPVVSMMRIMFAALDARRAQIPENQQPMDMSAVETWLAVAKAALWDVPDGRIYHDAVRRGDAFADIVDPNQDPPGHILHRLGVLHLDPYVGGRSSQQLDVQLRAWQSRLEEEYGEELSGIPDDEIRMPRIEQALPKAVEYLRRAAVLRSGAARGQTLKAMVQALTWQDIIKMPVDPSEIVTLAREALVLLPDAQFPGEHAELTHLIEHFGKQTKSAPVNSGPVAEATKVMETPVSTWVERIGEGQTEDLFTQSAIAVQELNPMLALRLLLAIEDLVMMQPEAKRDVYNRSTIAYVRRALAPDAPSADGTPVRKMIEPLIGAARRERLNQKKFVYALFWLAVSTTRTNQEDEGLEALEIAEQLSDETDPLFSRLAPYARAMLQTGSAVNAYDRGDLGTAASLYAVAMKYHLEANQPLAALDILRRLVDVAKPGETDALESLVAALMTNALTLEHAAGDAATQVIQFACRYALAALSASGTLKLTVVLMIWDVAKGRRFGAALAQAGQPVPWLEDPLTIEHEQEMAQLHAQVIPQSKLTSYAIDEDLLLTAYVSPKEMRGGANAAEQLRNMQIRFDTALDRELSRRREDQIWVPEIESIQALLDDRTVLMLQYIGVAPGGMLSLMTLLITREESAASLGIIQGLPSSSVVMNDGEETVTSNLLSFGVSDLRSKLLSPPGPLVADSRALEKLDADVGDYLGGGLAEKLSAMHAAGKDHLCIWPHGPLHYYPFHLLGPENKPLAEDWCITYISNLRLLVRPTPAYEGKAELTSIGVNFGANNVHKLPPISEPEPEAHTIAAVYDTHAIVGKAATESAVISALTNSRRVHIATHGRHNVSAPAFQCLYVQPDEGSDGVIHAYELLRLDLRGLDLVTLSACETALGRFDIADNLRGIPAALLIAGVSTIVGTLWQVETNTTTRFFELFYGILKDSGAKRDAFCEAQKKTRLEFPEYWNWGAFQLIGSWE